MDMNEWKQEQERLNQVSSKLLARLAELEPQVSGLYDQAAEIRKRFWEEVSINTSSDEDFEESFYSIKQQSVVLAERERIHNQLLQQSRSMKRLLASPYFGRIDFQEQGFDFNEQIYIGVSSFLDDDGLSFLIYDWRTPIASLYYDYSPGPASYDTPSGRITGNMSLKRQYQIRNGQVNNMFDASETIGDQLLQEILGGGANAQMKSIVATIQREQNEIIRNDSSRMLIVQGAAGSGKTSAALQRAAYLLYKHRDTLKADQIVLFSPNSLFNSYVSSVLPELGEENMQQTTFQEYLRYWLDSALKTEDPFDQIEYTLTAQEEPGYEARIQAMRYKASEGYMKALQQYAEWLGLEGMLFKSIWLRDRELITADQIRAQFYSKDSTLRLADRVERLQEWLLQQLSRLEREERKAPWVEEELHYLDFDQYAEVFGKLHKDREVFDIAEHYAAVYEKIKKKRRGDEADFDYAEKEEELLIQAIVKASFKPIRQNVRKRTFIDTAGIYAQLFEDPSAYLEKTADTEIPPLWEEICRQTRGKLQHNELFYEDATPYLFLKEMIEGLRTNKEIQHVFVDEGQDYSPFQYAYLRKLFPSARMTVLGDFGQAIFTQATDLQQSNSPLVHLFGEAETCLVRLERSYRPTKEIVNFTSALLDGDAGIIPFERSGPKPVLAALETEEARNNRIRRDIAALQAEGLESVAILTKTAAESRKVYEVLSNEGDTTLQLITKDTVNFRKGAMVIPVYLAKGMEFDAVLVYDSSSEVYGQEYERKLLYTACTRAMHRLHLYTTGSWSPFVQNLPSHLYVLETC